MASTRNARSLGYYAVLALAIGLVFNALMPVGATHQPANKAVASGNTVPVLDPGTRVPLLQASLKTSAPTDLVLNVNAECALTTNVTTVGNEMSRAEGSVRVWVEIDGRPIGIKNVGTSTTSSQSSDNGRVTFCQRAYQRTTSAFNDTDATIETFFETREANSFSWLALNVGRGVHSIVVYGELTETETNKATAKAAVGNRTLIVLPEKLANDASV